LLVLVGDIPASQIQELTAEKTDAVTATLQSILHVLRPSNVGTDLHSVTVERAALPLPILLELGAGVMMLLEAELELP
jgi:hypothetical protein